MEHIKNQLQQAQHLSKSQQLQKKNSDICLTANNEISIYQGELTKEVVAESLHKIKNSFPALSGEFYTIFTNRIKENGFSNERLTAAVNHVIDNCVYPQPTIAQFIAYDKKIKLYDYQEYLQYLHENKGSTLIAIRVQDRKNPMFAKPEDVEQYKLTQYK